MKNKYFTRFLIEQFFVWIREYFFDIITQN